jgi:hypothetical protein
MFELRSIYYGETISTMELEGTKLQETIIQINEKHELVQQETVELKNTLGQKKQEMTEIKEVKNYQMLYNSVRLFVCLMIYFSIFV